MESNTRLSPYSPFLTLKCVIAQIKNSKIGVLSLIIFLLSTSACFTTEITGTGNQIRGLTLWYLSYSFGALTYFFFSIAISTAIHETGHLQVVKELGLTAVLHVNRLGDVWIHYPPVTQQKLSEEEHYSIGIRPYTRFIDFVTLPILAGGWMVIVWNAPLILDVVAWIGLSLYIIKIIADICAYLTVGLHLSGGIIPRVAWYFTSRGDIGGIIEYHLKNKP